MFAVRTVTSIRSEWLIEIAPHYYDLSNFPKNDTRVALERLYLRRAEQERKERGGTVSGAISLAKR